MGSDEPPTPVPLVFVYWDYACPHSYLTHLRLLRLETERPLTVHWRPLWIDRSAGDADPGASRPTSLDRAPVETEAERAEIEGAAHDLGRELLWPSRFPDTRGALQAAMFARDLGVEPFGRLHDRVFRVLFEEGAAVEGVAWLLDLAAEAGVDRLALEGALADDRYEEELQRARGEAERYAIDATPTCLFGRFKLVGAAPLDALRDVADRASDKLGDCGAGSPGAENLAKRTDRLAPGDIQQTE